MPFEREIPAAARSVLDRRMVDLHWIRRNPVRDDDEIARPDSRLAGTSNCVVMIAPPVATPRLSRSWVRAQNTWPVPRLVIRMIGYQPPPIQRPVLVHEDRAIHEQQRRLRSKRGDPSSSSKAGGRWEARKRIFTPDPAHRVCGGRPPSSGATTGVHVPLWALARGGCTSSVSSTALITLEVFMAILRGYVGPVDPIQ